MEGICLTAYAKINLFLEVGERRSNGYHNIDSVMQRVSLSDSINFTPTNTGKIDIECNVSDIGSIEDNTVYRAASEFFRFCGISGGGSFVLNKAIPHQAGLGGGSADAAAAIVALNECFSAGLNLQQMCEIAFSVGSDVPFMIAGGTKLVRGIGEVLYDCARLPDCNILIAKPNVGVSTAEAYRLIDEAPVKSELSAEDFLYILSQGDLKQIAANMYNAFERVILPRQPQIALLKETMLNDGALGSIMSGSGSAVFGIYGDDNTAVKTCSKLLQKGFSAFICRPVDE